MKQHGRRLQPPRQRNRQWRPVHPAGRDLVSVRSCRIVRPLGGGAHSLTAATSGTRFSSSPSWRTFLSGWVLSATSCSRCSRSCRCSAYPIRSRQSLLCCCCCRCCSESGGNGTPDAECVMGGGMSTAATCTYVSITSFGGVVRAAGASQWRRGGDCGACGTSCDPGTPELQRYDMPVLSFGGVDMTRMAVWFVGFGGWNNVAVVPRYQRDT